MALTYCQGFGTQNVSTLAGPAEKEWNTVANTGQVSFVAGRVAGVAARIAANGASTNLRKTVVPASPTRWVTSIWFRFNSALPGADSEVYGILTAGGINPLRLRYILSDGKMHAQIENNSNELIMAAPVVGTWHHFDCEVSGIGTTTWTIKARMDGVDYGTDTDTGRAASTITDIRHGTGSAHTYTIDLDDELGGDDAGYPLGKHRVVEDVPTADGTHAGGANVIEDNAGVDIVTPGYTTAWQLVDEWPANTTDYIQQVANGSTSYAEVAFPDALGVPKLVQAYCAFFSSATQANNGISRVIKLVGNPTIQSGDMSETALQFCTALISEPTGGWTEAEYNALTIRCGHSTDSAPNPRWTAFMLQYAIPDTPAATEGSEHQRWMGRVSDHYRTIVHRRPGQLVFAHDLSDVPPPPTDVGGEEQQVRLIKRPLPTTRRVRAASQHLEAPIAEGGEERQHVTLTSRPLPETRRVHMASQHLEAPIQEGAEERQVRVLARPIPLAGPTRALTPLEDVAAAGTDAGAEEREFPVRRLMPPAKSVVGPMFTNPEDAELPAVGAGAEEYQVAVRTLPRLPATRRLRPSSQHLEAPIQEGGEERQVIVDRVRPLPATRRVHLSTEHLEAAIREGGEEQEFRVRRVRPVRGPRQFPGLVWLVEDLAGEVVRVRAAQLRRLARPGPLVPLEDAVVVPPAPDGGEQFMGWRRVAVHRVRSRLGRLALSVAIADPLLADVILVATSPDDPLLLVTTAPDDALVLIATAPDDPLEIG